MVKIFVSSTSKDLADHRKTVIDILREANHQPIAMETFGSKPGNAQLISLNEVAKADLFIGIYARRYGFRPASDQKSVTEQEYDKAKALNLDCLIFISADDYAYPLIDAHAETDPRGKADLANFIKRLEFENVRALFTSPEDLGHKVLLALANWLSDQNDRLQQTPPPSPTRPTTEIHGDNNGQIFNGSIGNNANFGSIGNNANFGTINQYGNRRKPRRSH